MAKDRIEERKDERFLAETLKNSKLEVALAEMGLGEPFRSRAELIGKDAVQVTMPNKKGLLTLRFSEIDKSRRAFDCELEIAFRDDESYFQRINTLSQAAKESLRRELDNIYGKDWAWTEVLSQAFTLARRAYLELDCSSDPFEEAEIDGIRYLVEPLVTEGQTTIWFGDGSAGKSFLAMQLALCSRLGHQFVGLPVKPGNCLYLDYEENDGRIFRLRLDRLCRGMGLSGLPPNIIRRWAGRGVPLVDSLDAISQSIKRWDITWLIVDTVAGACGGDLIKPEIPNQFFSALQKLGLTTLVLAHVSAEANKGRPDRPFGSTYWHNWARRTWFVKRATVDPGSPEVDIGLYCHKVNDGPAPDPIGLRISYDDGNRGTGPVIIQTAALEDTPELEEHLPIGVRLWNALRIPKTVPELEELLGEPGNKIRPLLHRKTYGRRNYVSSGDPKKPTWARSHYA